MSELDDSAYLRFLEDFADSTEDNLADLAGEGIDAATVTAIRAKRTAFNTALKDQRKAIKARNTGQHERIEKGNALYKPMVKHCNTGKNIWENSDESKYNDYVIYHETGGAPAGTVLLTLEPGDVLELASDISGGDEGSIYVKKQGAAGTEVAIYFAVTADQPYAGTGPKLTDNSAHTLAPTDIGPVQPYLCAQNTGTVICKLYFGVIE